MSLNTRPLAFELCDPQSAIRIGFPSDLIGVIDAREDRNAVRSHAEVDVRDHLRTNYDPKAEAGDGVQIAKRGIARIIKYFSDVQKRGQFDFGANPNDLPFVYRRPDLRLGSDPVAIAQSMRSWATISAICSDVP